MADILPFRKTGNGLKNDERLIQYLKALIEGKDPGDLIHHVNGKVLCLSVTKIDRSYEEMKLKFFSEGNLMTAPALSSMICLTPGCFRDEIEAIAAFEVQMWETIPHVERFITAHRGGFAYNFRAADHDIAQILFQLTAYDKDDSEC